MEDLNLQMRDEISIGSVSWKLGKKLGRAEERGKELEVRWQ